MMKSIGILVVLLLGAARGTVLADMLSAPVDDGGMCRDSLREETLAVRKSWQRDSLFPKMMPNVGMVKGNMSLVYLPDSLILDSLKYEYTKIKDFAYRKRWTKELYKMVFVNPRSGYLNVMRTQNSEERFRRYAGKTIERITIKVLPPYGTSVYDTTYIEEDMGWLKTLANKTHMSTAESVIGRQLTIRPGRQLQPFEMVQNEILLRQVDYIDDASLTVTEVAGDTNRVNVMVICRDQLSWGATIETNMLNTFILGLDNKNFMKLGHILNYEFGYRGTKCKKWSNILEYKVNSIWGTHANVRGYYQNNYKEKKITLDVDRQFLTSQMRWGGGLSLGRIFYSDRLPDRNVNRLEELFNYHYQDVWIGHSFRLPYRYLYTRNLYLTGRFFNTVFDDRPQVSDDTNHLYYNRQDYFAALTFVKIKYYKANLIYDFGRTEDIPSGFYSSLTGGFEKSEFHDYGYIGMESRYSHFNKVSERFYAVEAAWASYIGSQGFTRGVLKIGGRHISNLCSIGGVLKFRFYNSISYIRGIRRYPADYLYMMDQDIRGFSSDTLRGNQKLSATLAATLFLPYIKRGFRMSVSSFVDMGVLAPENKPLARTKTYWGIGVALNFRNDNVVIKNLSFRFTLYPTIPADGRRLQAALSSHRREAFYDYRVTKPQAVQYE